MYVPDAKRTKLDDKSFKAVLLGVKEGTKAYKLFIPTTKQVVISRDVIFEENESWDWTQNGTDFRFDVLEWGENERDENVQNDHVAELNQEEGTQSSSEKEDVLSNTSSDGDNIISPQIAENY